jgi:hypothetical protein
MLAAEAGLVHDLGVGIAPALVDCCVCAAP